MNRKIPNFLWNLIEVFFLGWFTTASWLLLGGDTSAIVRFAFAFCGSLGIFAGLQGSIFHRIWRLGRKMNCHTRYVLIGMVIMLFVIAGAFKMVLIPFREGMRGYMRTSTYKIGLDAEGASLLTYTKKHGGKLPYMFRNSVYQFIQRHSFQDGPSCHFVWCGELRRSLCERFPKPCGDYRGTF